MPRKTKMDAQPLATHVEPYVFSSDEETPAAKARPLKSRASLGMFDPEDPLRTYEKYARHEGAYEDTYTPRAPKALGDLPWKSAYLPEKIPGDPTKHITYAADENIDPEHHKASTGDFLRRLSDTKFELVRLIHNHWVFKASYYILAQQELEHIHAGQPLSKLKYCLHKVQTEIENERKYQMSFGKDQYGEDEMLDTMVQTKKQLRRFRNNITPNIPKMIFKATHAAVQTLLEQYAASEKDLKDWTSVYEYYDDRTHEKKNQEATTRPPTSHLVMKRLFFAKCLLMRAVEHLLRKHPLTVDTDKADAVLHYSSHGDTVSEELVKLRKELRTRFPKRASGHTTATSGPTPATSRQTTTTGKKKGRKSKKTGRKARASGGGQQTVKA